MARIEEIERRLLNWARWHHQMRNGGGNYAGINWEELEKVDKSGGWDAALPIPTNDAEAEQTEQAVRALLPDLRAAVVKVYVEGGHMRDKARSLGVSEATVYLRVDQAHRAISAWVEEKRRAAEAQRARVEKLQRSAGQF